MSFFAKEIMDEEWGNYFELTGAGYGILIACMAEILLAACFLSGKKKEEKLAGGQMKLDLGGGADEKTE